MDAGGPHRDDEEAPAASSPEDRTREDRTREDRTREPGGTGYLLLFAGLLTWAMIGVPYVAMAIEQPARRNLTTLVLLAAHAVFGVLLVASFQVFRRSDRPHAARNHRRLLVAQSAAALVAIIVMPESLLMILFVIVASQVPLSNSLPVSLAWVGIQTAIAAPIAQADQSLGRAIVITGTEIGFQLFAVYASTTAAREREARSALARVNAELVSTRELLANSSRLAERQRISRDLHDLMGHHLTALSLQLETASHQASGEVGARVRAARGIAGGLLDDVRQVVRAFRTDNEIELAGPLRTLVNAIQRPNVHLELPERLEIDDPVRANAILRSVQEIVTNAARHAEAPNLWITIERQPAGLVISARDDGKGARAVRFGSGLDGMRERLAELGGSITVDTAPGRGFRLDLTLPLSEASS